MSPPGFSAAEESSFISQAQWAAFVHSLIHSLTQQRAYRAGVELLNTTHPVLAAMKQEPHMVYSVVDKSVGLTSWVALGKLFPCLLASVSSPVKWA